MMKFSLIVLVVSLSAASYAHHVIEYSRNVDEAWETYKTEHDKHHSPEEEPIRKANFAKIHDNIQKHNAGNPSYKMTHNRFSDMHDDEKQQHLGAKFNGKLRVWKAGDKSSCKAKRALPSSLDYRTHKCLQPVKDQGYCGSCWSFATICALEFSKCNKTGVPVNLSEQQLVDCDTKDNGCNGGFYTNAWSYLKNAGGVETTANYGAYTSGNTENPGTCRFSSSKADTKVDSYGMVASSEIGMMTAIQKGPLAVAITVVDSLYSYESGIYKEATCTEQTVNHAVTVVGYGSSNGTNYWVIRNSWGTGWGQAGYMYIQRGVNMCNVESLPATVVAA